MSKKSREARDQKRRQGNDVAKKFKEKHDPHGFGMTKKGEEVFRFLQKID